MTLYEDLHVEVTASITEIKKSFRKLALEHHPDRGGDKNKFQQINLAYETLSDEGKRSQYDQTLRPPQSFRPEDIMNEMFGGRNMFNIFFNQRQQQPPKRPPVKCSDESYTLKVPFKQVLACYNKQLKKTVFRLCKECVKECPNCTGQGLIVVKHVFNGHQVTPVFDNCGQCQGKGLKYAKVATCVGCNFGKQVVEVDVHVNIPKHQMLKKEYVLETIGAQPSKGYETPGNFIVHIELVTPPDTKIDALGNIIYSPTINIIQLVKGCDIKIPDELDLSDLSIPCLSLQPDFMITVPSKGLYTTESTRANFFFKPIIDYKVDTSLIKLNLLHEAFKAFEEDLNLQNGTLKRDADKQTE